MRCNNNKALPLSDEGIIVCILMRILQFLLEKKKKMKKGDRGRGRETTCSWPDKREWD